MQRSASYSSLSLLTSPPPEGYYPDRLPEDQWSDQIRRYAGWGIGIYADAQQGNTESSTL